MIKKGIPESAMDIMLSSLSHNTVKQYDVCYKRWFRFCNNAGIDLFNQSVPDIIRFLTELFQEGAQYSTLNTYRSALSLISLNRISEDDCIKRFFKGIFRLRTPSPKYNMTWDTSTVLNFLAAMYPNDSLNLENLSYKTITLLALIKSHRAQTLSKIKINNILVESTKIIIKIPDLIKTSRPGSNQPLLLIPFFDERPEICPGRTLNRYIDVTKSLRHNNCDHLFISFRKPHKLVSSQTLSRWVKTTLGRSGIDLSIFSAHSTRHASTSKANNLGVNLDTIRRTAGWSDTSSTFARFYNKPVISTNDDSLARALLLNSMR